MDIQLNFLTLSGGAAMVQHDLKAIQSPVGVLEVGMTVCKTLEITYKSLLTLYYFVILKQEF